MLIKGSKEIQVLTRGDAIRKKCLDCCCFSRHEVQLCISYDCVPWPYRLGSYKQSMKYLPDDFTAVDCRVQSTKYAEKIESEGVLE